MKQLLLLLLLAPAFGFGQGDQTMINVPINQYGATEQAILHLPNDYSQTSTQYPILVFLHGIGEGGTNPATIYNSSSAGGPAYYIAQGQWPASFVNPADGKSYKYIVVSPQNNEGWSTSAPELEYVLTYLMKTYRADPSRLYLTGLSAGGEGICEYLGNATAAGTPVNGTHKVAAFIPMSAVMNTPYIPQYAANIVANNNRMWGFGSPPDIHGINTLLLATTANTLSLNPNFALTTTYSGGHCCWGQFYNPSFTQNGMNIYQWALQYTTGGNSSASAPPPPPPPVTTPPPVSLPGRVEAENYATMSGVATENCSEGTLDVGSIDQGDWMNYLVTVGTAGQYTVSFRVATPNGGSSLQLLSSTGAVLANVNVPVTGGFQNWQTVTATVTLPAGSQTLRVQSSAASNWNINWLQFDTYTPPPPSGPSPVSLPGKVEAENYTTMSGVATENCSEGTLDVGWIDQGDWMNYSVNVGTAGQFTASFRVATPNAGASFQLLSSTGAVLANINVPNTGGYQVWQTVTAIVTLPAGAQTLRLQSTATPIWNINWLQFNTYTPPPPSGPSPVSLPGKVEAENYTTMSGVATENCSEGTLDVGWIDQGDWMNYGVNVGTAGQFTASFRVATPNAGASFQLLSSTGAVLANINVPNTGGYQVWQTVTAIVTLPAGAQTLRLQSTATPIWNINWLQFDTYTPPPPPSNPGVATIPGKIESESYSNMSGVATESSTDGTLDVGWIDRNDWMDYNVNVTTGGQYTASFRIATPNSNAVFQLLTSGGTVLATISVPNTGGYQVWQTITATVNLPAGAQTLRIASIANDGWNINWMQFDAIAPPVSSGNSIPGKIEAESYSNMSGVATESCSEGTLDVGWIDRNDWMDYNVNVTAAGQYTASFRVATPNNNAVFQLITSGGTVLATVGLPNTGGYQNWQTVTVSVNLPAGPQTLRIASIANDGWNINWMQFSVPGSSQAIGTTGQAQSAAAALLAGDDIAQRTTLFPNPVKDVFTIRMNNNLAGKMLVQITDASGKVMQVNSFVKEPGLSQVTINTAGLSTGIYFVRILVGDQSEVKKIFRL